MSVVGNDYDKLKRYNLAEIYDPTPRPKQSTEKGTGKGKDSAEQGGD